MKNLRTERNIRLIIAYDGTTLHGYQRQDNSITVQEEVENALSKVCNEKITIYGSSRTDAGVHARFQVVTFFTTGSIPVKNLQRALIAFLPPYIVVRDAVEMPMDWRVRHHTFGKKYIYTLYNHIIEDPLHRLYHWHIKKMLNVENMKEASRILLGTHDFTTFAGKNTTPQDPVKTIYEIAIIQKGNYLDIHVIGNGFLYHMVRNIVGMLVDVGLGRMAVADVKKALEAKNRTLLGKTAPAQGLCLEQVYFTKEELVEDLAKYR